MKKQMTARNERRLARKKMLNDLNGQALLFTPAEIDELAEGLSQAIIDKKLGLGWELLHSVPLTE